MRRPERIEIEFALLVGLTAFGIAMAIWSRISG